MPITRTSVLGHEPAQWSSRRTERRFSISAIALVAKPEIGQSSVGARKALREDPQIYFSIELHEVLRSLGLRRTQNILNMLHSCFRKTAIGRGDAAKGLRDFRQECESGLACLRPATDEAACSV